MSTIRNARGAGLGAVAAVMGAALIISCGGGSPEPKSVMRRMVRAHGGSAKIERVQSYVGRGFMKSLGKTAVAQSDPFDIYRRGNLFKNRIVRLSAGTVTDIGITVYDGTEGYQYRYGAGRNPVPQWQFDILRYLYPMVLQWAEQNVDRGGEIVTGEHEYAVERVRYVDGDHIITIAVDDGTWLLKEVRITSVSDSVFSFSEAYGDYREVDGIPFPGRFSASFRGGPYYEYFLPVIEHGVVLPDSIFSVTVEDTIDMALQDTLRGAR